MSLLLSQREGLVSSLKQSKIPSWDTVHSSDITAFKVRKLIYIFKATDGLSKESLGMCVLIGRINLYKLNIFILYTFVMLNIYTVNINKKIPVVSFHFYN